MEPGDTVRAGGQPQPHHRHVELAVRFVGPCPEFEQVVERHPARVGELREVRLEQLPREAIDAGRHRGVGGEHPARPYRFDRLGERQPLLGPLPYPFEAEEPGVALVGVEHLRMQVERPQGPDAADAEHDLLAEPVLLVAAVEPVRDGDRLGWVPGNVRVEQVQTDPPHVDPPHPDLHVDAGEIDDDLHAGRLRAERRGVDAGVRLLLPAVGVEVLMEVALGVQQPDADERHAEVGGRLQVIAGEHPEPAGVLRERLGDAELGREVGDEIER